MANLIFSYMSWLGPFFWIHNFALTYFGGLQKNNICGDMTILLIFILGHHKIGIDSMRFRFSFLRSWVTENLNICLWGVLDISDIFEMNGRCWVQAYVCNPYGKPLS